MNWGAGRNPAPSDYEDSYRLVSEDVAPSSKGKDLPDSTKILSPGLYRDSEEREDDHKQRPEETP